MSSEFGVRPRRRRRGNYRPSADERNSASLCHLLGIFMGFIGPIIIWTTKKEESRFVDHHGREALNFGLNMLILNLVLGLIIMIVAVLTCGFGALLVPLMFIPYIYALVMHIS